MATTTPKFPSVKVRLSGQDGNAFAIIGRCREAAKHAKVPAEDIAAFTKEAMSGDYEHVLATCLDYFDCR
jgi:hypothetical protein